MLLWRRPSPPAFATSARAQRNAEMLTRFTGRPAYAVVSSVRKELHVETEIAAGNVWWYELDERDMEVE